MTQQNFDPLTDGIYQPGIEPALEKEKKSFKPWHKPRKDLIRIKLWCLHIRQLIQTRKPTVGPKTLCYLGMPAEDFFDIRTLEGVCSPENVSLKYFGFDSSAPIEEESLTYYLTRHQATMPSFIDKDFFNIYPGRIEHIAQENSIPFLQFAKHGPYDVINIDPCDSVSWGQERYFEALVTLCKFQMEHQAQPWLFFLTTRVGKDHIDNHAMKGLLKCILENTKQHEAFGDKVKAINLTAELLETCFDKINASPDKTKEILIEDHGLSAEQIINTFVLGIGKWLLHLLNKKNSNGVMVTLLPGYTYRVYGHTDPDMVSLGFWVEPRVPPCVDQSGITQAVEPDKTALSEEKLAIDLVEKTLNFEDADRIMRDDQVAFSDAKRRTKALLQKNDYPIEGYDAWVDSEIQKVVLD